ncbi:MAG: hypothetical protein J6E29_06805 [Prevotella sp.]|nr:hypothetical protein [Prevotella sp.]
MQSKNNNPWVFALAFVMCLAIGFGASELVTHKLFTQSSPNEGTGVPPVSMPPSESSEEKLVDAPSDGSPITKVPDDASDQPTTNTGKPVEVKPAVTQPSKAKPALSQPSEPQPSVAQPSEPQPSTSRKMVAQPTRSKTSEVKSTSSSANTRAEVRAITNISVADAQSIVASGKSDKKIPDGTTIVVNGTRRDYQDFRTGVNQKAYSNVKVTKINDDGSISVTATENKEEE